MLQNITDIHLEKLLDKIKLLKLDGVYVDVKPTPNSKLIECITNVENKIKLDGGQKILGWQISQTNILIEAEFHAVWKSPNGILEDVTPKDIPVDRILFFADDKLVYDGSQKDNIRCNITENRLVNDLIQLFEAHFKILNIGNRKYRHGETTLEGQEAQLYSTIEKMKIEINQMINQGLTRNSYCFCGSKKKYKHCHGKKLSKALNKIYK